MKTFLVFFIAATLMSVETKAQSIWTKIGTTVSKGEQAKSAYDKVKGWLPKRKDKGDTTQKTSSVASNAGSKKTVDSVTAQLNTTVLTVTGIDFSTLKKLSDNLQSCEGVKSAKMKYNSSASTIEISHLGNTENLLALMAEKSKDIFTEKNIEGFEEGKIEIKLK